MYQPKFSNRIADITGSAIRELFKLTADPKIISFGGGNPSPKTFPVDEMDKISSIVMREEGAALLQYGATEGYLPLRKILLERLEALDVKAALENLLPVTGSSQGIELAIKCLINEGDTVIVESPTFLGTLQTINSYKGVPVGVAMDDEGIILDKLEDQLKRTHAKLIYLIPTFQNPSGRTMSIERRKAVYDLACKYDCAILEDDPYGELRYEGETLPFIKSFDKDERVILLKSFSKTVSPGLRLGYAVAQKDLLRKMVVAKQGMDVHSCNLVQAIVYRFIKDGLYEPHVARSCTFYKGQYAAMKSAIDSYFPKSVKATSPQGGFFLWLELPENVSGMDVFTKALESNVAFVPGEHFYFDGSGKNTMRLSYSMPSNEDIDKGMKALGSILTQLC